MRIKLESHFILGCRPYKGQPGYRHQTAVQLQESLNASKAGGFRLYEIVQIRYNLLIREMEPEMFPLC